MRGLLAVCALLVGFLVVRSTNVHADGPSEPPASGRFVVAVPAVWQTGPMDPLDLSAANDVRVYGNALDSRWQNWSWGGTTDFAYRPAFSGPSPVLAFTGNTPYAGLYLHSVNGIDTVNYLELRFSLRASLEGQSFGIVLYDANGREVAPAVPLGRYGTLMPTWREYRIPLNDLSSAGRIISGFAVIDGTGAAQPRIYLANVRFVSATVQATPTTIARTPTPIPTAIGETPTARPSATSVSATPTSTRVAATPTPIVATPVPTTVPVTNPFTGVDFYVNAASPARIQAEAWRVSRPADAALMDKIANQSAAVWFGDWNTDVRSDVDRLMVAAAGRLPLLVAYNLPNRDCGGYSAGNATAEQYRAWIRAFAAGIANRRSVVILEPDALAIMDCLSDADKTLRMSLLNEAVGVLAASPSVTTYIDMGFWIDPDLAANRLRQSGIDRTRGFILNVSNFESTSDMVTTGRAISTRLGGKPFLIDVSRNGLGPSPDNAWCNPAGRALGRPPTTTTGDPLVDAWVWAKVPGESDGTCDGGPAAGQWWADYALGLAARATW